MKLALDLDGTLVTCGPKQMTCLRHVLNRMGLSADLSEVWEAKRNGATTKQALENAGLGLLDAARAYSIWSRCVEAPFWAGFDRPFRDVRATLKRLVQAGITPILLTARSRPEWVKPQLRALGLLPFLGDVYVVSPTNAADEKAAILAEWNAELYVGDTESDMDAARKAGSDFVAVSCGQRSSEYLSSKGGQSIVPSLAQAVLARVGI